MHREFNFVERKCCPVCGSTENKNVLTHYDDRYGQPDLYDVLECQNQLCQLSFLKQPVADKDLSDLYSKYYHHRNVIKNLPKVLDCCKQGLKRVRDFIYNNDNLYSRIQHTKRVLDVGCGYGPSVFFLKKKSIDWVGLEIDPIKALINRQKGLKCHSLDLEEFAKKSNERFDVILVNQVIEHVSNPIGFFQAIRKLLTDKGNAHFSTPNYDSKYRYINGASWIHWHVPYHQLYFNSHSFTYLTQKTGFKVVEIYTRTPFLFFVLQRNVKPCERGKKNQTFHEGKSIGDLIYFKDLGNFKSKRRFDEDCLYANICVA